MGTLIIACAPHTCNALAESEPSQNQDSTAYHGFPTTEMVEPKAMTEATEGCSTVDGYGALEDDAFSEIANMGSDNTKDSNNTEQEAVKSGN